MGGMGLVLCRPGGDPSGRCMENGTQETRPHDVSYFAFEAVMAREERHIKRLTIALIVAIVGIVVCNMAWLYAWTQYDYVSDGESVETTVSLDGSPGGNANYIGTRGVINNGKDYGYNQADDTEDESYQEVWK